jgi:hypothetical protein
MGAGGLTDATLFCVNCKFITTLSDGVRRCTHPVNSIVDPVTGTASYLPCILARQPGGTCDVPANLYVVHS